MSGFVAVPDARQADWLWSQPAILSVPATDSVLVAKAVERRTDALSRLLEHASIAADDVAQRLGIQREQVEQLLASARPVPAVMLDGEDAARGTDDEIATAVATSLRDSSWQPGTARFVRLAPGPSRTRQLDVIARHLAGAAPGSAPDSVVLPKAVSPSDVMEALAELERLEDRIGSPRGRVRVHLLIETAAGVAAVRDLAQAASSRLAGVMFGALDYAAEAGLPDPAEHASAGLAWARSQVVNGATEAGVAALDGMTTAFPPGRRSSDGNAAAGMLWAIETTYNDARRAAAQGMSGKLVGHPAQLLAVLLAYGEVYSARAQQQWRAIIAAYDQDMTGGAMTYDMQMIDQASVRHARTMLARARAAGYAGAVPAGAAADAEGPAR